MDNPVSLIRCNDPSDQYYENYMQNLIEQVNRDFPFSDAVKRRDEAAREAVRVHGSLEQIPEEVRNEIRVNYPVTDENWFNSVYIWVVAMNDVRPYLSKVGSQFDRIAAEHNGDLIDLTTRAQMQYSPSRNSTRS
jgi:hypothetical protein